MVKLKDVGIHREEPKKVLLAGSGLVRERVQKRIKQEYSSPVHQYFLTNMLEITAKTG